MNRFFTSTAVLLALSATAACGDRRPAEQPADAVPANQTVNPPTATTTAPEGVAFTYADDKTAQGFVQRMAMSDMYEIEASRVALERSQSPNVRTFAQMMIDAHTATTNEAKVAVQSEKVSVNLPTGLDIEHQRMVNDLRSADTTTFDRTYLDQQTKAHQTALDELQDYGKTGDNATFKAWAMKTSTAVQQHLDRAKTLDRAGADGTQTPVAPTP